MTGIRLYFFNPEAYNRVSIIENLHQLCNLSEPMSFSLAQAAATPMVQASLGKLNDIVSEPLQKTMDIWKR